MSHQLRSLIISQREAAELVLLEILAQQANSIPAKVGVILNKLLAVLSF